QVVLPVPAGASSSIGAPSVTGPRAHGMHWASPSMTGDTPSQSTPPSCAAAGAGAPSAVAVASDAVSNDEAARGTERDVSTAGPPRSPTSRATTPDSHRRESDRNRRTQSLLDAVGPAQQGHVRYLAR